MIAALRQRAREWLESRLPRTDTWQLNQRNIYILPTRPGLAFAAVLVVMLLASINYQLSLGYVLTFLLAGTGFVSMHLTHNTLRGMTLHLRPPASGFAGEPMPLEIVLVSPRGTQHGVGLGFQADAQGEPAVFVDVPAGGQATAQLAFVPPQRGRHTLPTLRVETRYPLGLFRAWSVWKPAAGALAWPRPETPLAPWPTSLAGPGEAAHARRSDSGDFDGVRTYRRGDALKHVVWKKAAKTGLSGELVSRDHVTALQHELWFDWQHTHTAGTEPRLSRLAAWVIAADGAGLAHGLRLPGVEVAPGHGATHRRASLDALALWS